MAIKYIRATDRTEIDKLLCGFPTNRKVISELTYPIYVDDNCVFYFASFNDKIIGFCSAIQGKGKVMFSHAYVVNEFRNKGVYFDLFQIRFNEFANKEIHAVCTKKSINTFLRFGFNIEKQTKNYTFVNLNKKPK